MSECRAGDRSAAHARLEALAAAVDARIASWRRPRAPGGARRHCAANASADADGLARGLLDSEAVPREAAADAAHIPIAVTNGVEYLVTWNFRRIANAAMRVRIERTYREAGYESPVICTPNELMETGHGDDPA